MEKEKKKQCFSSCSFHLQAKIGDGGYSFNLSCLTPTKYSKAKEQKRKRNQ
jgi:hypothetical protein